MFGPRMRIEYGGFGITLRPFNDADLSYAAEGMSNFEVLIYTKQLGGKTLEQEKEWYKKTADSPTDWVWAIQVDDQEYAIGVTGIHGVRSASHSCTTGIIIWDKSYWGRGIASRAHLGRTLYAADDLNRFLIESSVRFPNEPSLRALERVGYNRTGVSPRTAKRAGRYLDTYHVAWIHPEMISVLYPEGLPEEYREGVERARIALEKARQVVEFL